VPATGSAATVAEPTPAEPTAAEPTAGPTTAGRTAGRGSVRLRTTAMAVLVVAVALAAGAVALVALMRGSLRAGLEAGAEQRAAALATQLGTTGLPPPSTGVDDGDGNDGGDGNDRSDGGDGDEGEPAEIVWQVTTAGGTLVRSSQPLDRPLPTADTGDLRLPGAEHRYLVVTEDAGAYDVTVAVSLEEVDESTAALITPLLLGLPLMLLLVGGTTWVVVGRTLAPVDRIRREVEEITGDRLDRRVPEPPAYDEIGRLARTMNRMLGRLQSARDRQQQFIADASHELRSPLTGIRQAAEVARAHPGALPDGELAGTVLAESARMQRLVEQLLLLARTGDGQAAGPRQDVDLDDLALDEARRLRQAGLDVDTSAVGAGRVRGDRAALAQVVRNLVDNAARHATATVALTVRETGGGVELVVEDDGRGIAEADRQRVFDRFVRLDEARDRDAGGSGLGLAIVREIVAAHGGRVTAGASGRGGARFAVRFPG
jgi:signal transduction histidine kinase